MNARGSLQTAGMRGTLGPLFKRFFQANQWNALLQAVGWTLMIAGNVVAWAWCADLIS